MIYINKENLLEDNIWHRKKCLEFKNNFIHDLNLTSIYLNRFDIIFFGDNPYYPIITDKVTNIKYGLDNSGVDYHFRNYYELKEIMTKIIRKCKISMILNKIN